MDATYDLESVFSGGAVELLPLDNRLESKKRSVGSTTRVPVSLGGSRQYSVRAAEVPTLCRTDLNKVKVVPENLLTRGTMRGWKRCSLSSLDTLTEGWRAYWTGVSQRGFAYRVLWLELFQCPGTCAWPCNIQRWFERNYVRKLRWATWVALSPQYL